MFALKKNTPHLQICQGILKLYTFSAIRNSVFSVVTKNLLHTVFVLMQSQNFSNLESWNCLEGIKNPVLLPKKNITISGIPVLLVIGKKLL